MSPGAIDTPIFEAQVSTPEAAGEMRARYSKTVPMGRLGSSDEVARAILYLACSDSSFARGLSSLSTVLFRSSNPD